MPTSMPPSEMTEALPEHVRLNRIGRNRAPAHYAASVERAWAAAELTVQGAMPREKDFKQTLCADIDGLSLHAACAAAPMTGRRWSNCAATSPVRHRPADGCKPTPPDRWC